MQIKELVKRAHENAVAKGFYPESEDKNIGELLMLVVSELGEALESHRKGKHGKLNIFLSLKEDDFNRWFESIIKDTFEDELADVIIRLCDMIGYLEIDIDDSEYSGSLMCAENIGECLFDFVKMISGLDHVIRYELKEIQSIAFLDLIRQIEFFCEMNNIDLEKHIELKMIYNATREYKHGKKY